MGEFVTPRGLNRDYLVELIAKSADPEAAADAVVKAFGRANWRPDPIVFEEFMARFGMCACTGACKRPGEKCPADPLVGADLMAALQRATEAAWCRERVDYHVIASAWLALARAEPELNMLPPRHPYGPPADAVIRGR
jgi:hypothetical protein